MNSMKHFSYFRRKSLGIVYSAVILILIGCLGLSYELGWIEQSTLHILFSWKMFTVVVGIYFLLKRRFATSLLLIFLGGYSILAKLSVVPKGAMDFLGPAVFIGLGLWLLFLPFSKKKGQFKAHEGDLGIEKSFSCNGFINSKVSFGSSHQIILDPCFKGGFLETVFGSSVLDLRRTKLGEGETVIKIECAFGSVDLLLPADWNVQTEFENICSDYKDKRYPLPDYRPDKPILIIKGELAFCNLHLKN